MQCSRTAQNRLSARRGIWAARWRSRFGVRDGQTLVEFGLAVPVFLLMLFGIFQAALLYKAQTALNQAASDAAHVLAAQASSGNPNGGATQADAPALAAIRAALASSNLNNIVQVQIFSADGNDQPKLASDGTNQSITNSIDMVQPVAPPGLTFSLENDYVYGTPPALPSPPCPVDQFYLVNPATQLSNQFAACSLRWNGAQWNTTTNQNGRHDQRCDEETVAARITYNYAALSFPFVYKLTLSAKDATTLEPRRFLENAGYQSTVTTCP